MGMEKKGQVEEILAEEGSWEVFRDYFDVWREAEEGVKALLKFLFSVKERIKVPWTGTDEMRESA